MHYLSRLFLIIFASTLTSTASTAERDFIIEGIIEPPLRWYDDKGELRGIDIDIINVVLAEMKNIIPSYQIRLLTSSPRLKLNWQAGKSDMVFTYSIKEERQEYLYYAKVPHIKQSYNFFLMKDFADTQKAKGHEVKFNNYADLEGFTLAATEGIAYTPEFWESVNNGTLKTFLVVHNELLMKMLLRSRVDIIPHNLFPGFWLAKQGGYLDQIIALPKPIKEKDYFNTFVKKSNYPGLQDQTIIDRYDEVVSAMKESGQIERIIQGYGIQKSTIR